MVRIHMYFPILVLEGVGWGSLLLHPHQWQRPPDDGMETQISSFAKSCRRCARLKNEAASRPRGHPCEWCAFDWQVGGVCGVRWWVGGGGSSCRQRRRHSEKYRPLDQNARPKTRIHAKMWFLACPTSSSYFCSMVWTFWGFWSRRVLLTGYMPL